MDKKIFHASDIQKLLVPLGVARKTSNAFEISTKADFLTAWQVPPDAGLEIAIATGRPSIESFIPVKTGDVIRLGAGREAVKIWVINSGTSSQKALLIGSSNGIELKPAPTANAEVTIPKGGNPDVLTASESLSQSLVRDLGLGIKRNAQRSDFNGKTGGLLLDLALAGGKPREVRSELKDYRTTQRLVNNRAYPGVVWSYGRLQYRANGENVTMEKGDVMIIEQFAVQSYGRQFNAYIAFGRTRPPTPSPNTDYRALMDYISFPYNGQAVGPPLFELFGTLTSVPYPLVCYENSRKSPFIVILITSANSGRSVYASFEGTVIKKAKIQEFEPLWFREENA